MLYKAILVLAHPEKIIALAYLFHWSLAIGAEALLHILFRPKSFVEGAVPSGVVCLVNQPLVIECLQTALYNGLVLRVGGTNKPIL